MAPPPAGPVAADDVRTFGAKELAVRDVTNGDLALDDFTAS